MTLKDISADKSGVDYVLELRKQFENGEVTVDELREWFFAQSQFRRDIILTGHFLGLPFQGTGQRRAKFTHGRVPSHSGHALETIDRTQMSSQSVVYEIGSGLAYQSLLFGLLTGARVIGVEWEASYCNRATEAAQKLGLGNVSFINDDALNLDYSDADVFFMYTPFWGEMLKRFVTDCLLPVARLKPITLAVHGPELDPLFETAWLERVRTSGPRGYRGSGGVTILRGSPETVAAAAAVADQWKFLQLGSKGARTMDTKPLVNAETVARIARLARLKVPAGQGETAAAELSKILDFAGKLNEVDTDGVEPMTSVADMTLAMRKDIVTDGDRRDDVLSNATEPADGSFFTVPKVVE